MATSQPSKGRGRGRGTTPSAVPPAPILTPTTDTSVLSTPITTDTPVKQGAASVTPVSHADTGISSAPSETQSTATVPKSSGTGRGRGTHLKRNEPLNDPYWTVSNLTRAQFFSHERPQKPDELGTLGEEVQLIANYFPVLNFPFRGLVYKYQIQIKNRKDLEIHRERRRNIYNSWLQSLCHQYPQINKLKIVFDNRSRILSFEEPLPDEYETGKLEKIMGPNRSNKQEEHSVIVQKVGKPVDLSLLQDIRQIFNDPATSNIRLEELQDLKQVLSIALHEHCSSHAAFVYNRTFFSPGSVGQEGEWDLGLGKAMWRGFYSCLVFSKGRHELLMNLDVSHTVFTKKQPFLDFLCEVMLHSPAGKRQYGRQRNVTKADGDHVLRFLDVRSPGYRVEAEFLLKQCKGLRVRSQDTNKPIVYEIVKLGSSASNQQFNWKSKGTLNRITVQQYYKEHYNLDLRFPSLPVLEMRNETYLPMELVDVEPARTKKITEEQRALLCRMATIQPNVYQRSIQQIRSNPKQQRFEDDPFVAAWNMNVDVKMITVPGRVLPMPDIVYTENYRVTRDGVRDIGTWEPKAVHFHKPTVFSNRWGIINLTDLDEKACEEFCKQLVTVGCQRGIKCELPRIYHGQAVNSFEADAIIAVVKNLLNAYADCPFFLVILPEKTTRQSKQAYRNFKKSCELDMSAGVVTQMIQKKNAVIGTRKDPNRWDQAKLNNIWLKINTKLEGTNSVLKVNDIIERFFSSGHRIMYVGADLSHPAPGAGHQPSVVAVVASADDVPNRYFKEIYKQDRPQQKQGESREFIVSMKEIMISLIQQYAQLRGYPPNAIVIYRDGISEGEFQTVFEKEITATREACVELSPAYRPYLTYIVVNKRHRTRFFPTDPTQKNVSAGTVVDSHDVTSPTTYDFFLNSHHGALGTSRPTHYHVLYDDNKLKPNEVQMLTYALCYTYARCTRSVSVPAPVKYADLLAFRARYYLDSYDESDTESVASGPRVPVNQDTNVTTTITSERIPLSGKLKSDCPFFL